MGKVQDIQEAQLFTEAAILRESLRELSADYQGLEFRMSEALSALDPMLRDNIGWTDISSYAADDGPSLSQLKARSRQLRSALALSPHLKRGSQLRTNYVWGDPMRYENVPGLGGSGRVSAGRGKRDVGRLVRDPINQRYVFGPLARAERERALFTDGMYFLLGDNVSKRMEPVPLYEISGLYTNPDNRSEVWAYRRTWSRYDSGQSKEVSVSRWYFTDLFADKGVGVESIEVDGQRDNVDKSKTLIDGSVNQQIGWSLGFPDAGCVLEWVLLYNKFIRSGLDMNQAMASIWATAKKETAAGASNVAAKVAGMSGSGKTAVGNVDLVPLATAGKTYDFKAGTPVLAIVAAGIGVSVVALSSSPGDAGSSYGAASTLDLPSRLETELRRNWHCAFDERVLRWMGAEDAVASFPPLVDADEVYRLKQSAALDLASGLYEAPELKNKYEGAEGNRGVVGPIPAGWEAPLPDGSGTGVQAAAPDQGQSNGAGTGLGSDDTRNDDISD